MMALRRSMMMIRAVLPYTAILTVALRRNPRSMPFD
jgi:hypothetical protein